MTHAKVKSIRSPLTSSASSRFPTRSPSDPSDAAATPRSPSMRFETYLRQSAERFPDKAALIASGRRFTYSQLDHLSDELAQGLINRGVGRGDRVVLFLDNSAEAVVSIFAVLKAGAVFSPVNPSTIAIS